VSVNGGEPNWRDAGYVLPPVDEAPSDESLLGTLFIVAAGTAAVGLLIRRKVRSVAR
jgi:hypothetical protein